jgi:hypothetical protein
MFHVPNQFRIKSEGHPLASSDSDGNYGAFRIPYQSYEFFVIASAGMGWEHVSISPMRPRMPSWKVMCFFKVMFWDEEDCVVQYHPPKSEYVNDSEYCLHLWRPIVEKMPLPPKILTGGLHG